MSPASMVHLESLRVEQSQPIVKAEDPGYYREFKKQIDQESCCICSAGNSDDVTVTAHIVPYETGSALSIKTNNSAGSKSNKNGARNSLLRNSLNSFITDNKNEDFRRSQIYKASQRKALIAQCLINTVIMFIVTAGGMPIGYSAILLPQLQSANSSMPTDDSWASWIASVHSTAAPMGSILAGPMMDKVGRRMTLQLSLLPIIAGWALMSMATNHVVLVIGRLLAGFAVGMIPGPSQVLIGELSEPSLRGLFSSMPSASYALGILLVYLAGSKLNWRHVACLGTVMPLIATVALFFIPESPVWLVNKNRPEDARKCLLVIRGGNEPKVSRELNTLMGHMRMERDKDLAAKREFSTTMCAPVPKWWQILTRPQVFKPSLIILVFCLLQILSGSYVAIFYGVSLIASASGKKDVTKHCLMIAVMTALVRFIVSIITSVCLLKLGRRKIGIISGIGTAISCLLLVTFLYVKRNNPIHIVISDMDDLYIVAGLIMTYVATNTFGIFSLPCMMIGEVLPANVRGSVSGILLMLINLMIFSTTKLYPSVANALGPIGVFAAFFVVSLVISVYVYLFLPETKNRPLTQIEEYFAVGKNYLWRNRDHELTKSRRYSL